MYEAMDLAKKAIHKTSNGDERKYNDIFAIIDKRWKDQLH